MSKKGILSGKVCKVAGNHVSVMVKCIRSHSVYHKYVKHIKKYMVKRVGSVDIKIGDKINFIFCKPISKRIFSVMVV